MRFPWFKRFGIVFVPKSIPGIVIVLAAMVFLVRAFIDIDGRSHSVSDTLMNFVFVLLIVTAVYTSIAYFTSKDRSVEHGE